jgi:hypothetical protein
VPSFGSNGTLKGITCTSATTDVSLIH